MRKTVLAVLLGLLSLPLSAKSLHWRALDVTAKLDAAGTLHIRERHVMLFDGDWNGGERTFNLRAGQTFALASIARIGDDGQEVPLVRGDLTQVDQYNFASSEKLRWRSRLPSDPPFEKRQLTYVIDYTLGNILRSEGGSRYSLDHDFAFPDRAEPIDAFSLRLDVDPAWQGLASPTVIERRDLPPHQGVMLQSALTFAGSTRPAAVAPMSVSPFVVNAVAGTFLLAIALLLAAFVVGEKRAGRYTPLPSSAIVNEEWVERTLTVLPPEIAGAAWDDSVGADEVAAVLARMTKEGKLETWVEQKNGLLGSESKLHMRLKVREQSLSGYERRLVEKFFGDATETDTDDIRQRYQRTGFDPAKEIEPGIRTTLASMPDWTNRRSRFHKSNLLLLAISVALMIAAAVGGRTDTVAVLATGAAVLVSALIGSIVAYNGSKNVAHYKRAYFWVGLVLSINAAAVLVACYEAHEYQLHWLTLVAAAAFGLTFIRIVTDALALPDSPLRLAFRRNVAAAREYFLQQLHAESPRLKDDWYPWLLALGLGRNVQKWFNAYGATGSDGAFVAGASSSGTSSTSSSSSSPSFTGGGGAFGGAGASGAWAAAVGTVASGVASPASSSGGGGGGGSSGGGGGGGW